MFIGHFAVGLAVKKAAPKISLGTLFIAAQFLDLIWPIFLLLGLEQIEVDPGNTVVTPFAFIHYPFSHSLLAVLGWATLVSLLYKIFSHDPKGAFWIWFAVVSHWILDAVTHRPDLPLYPGSNTLIGFGLWNSLAGSVLVEALLFVIGISLYLKTTRAKDKIGIYALWSLLVFLVLVYVGNIFGPPPPANAQAIAIVGLSQWLLVFWGYWIDRHREI